MFKKTSIEEMLYFQTLFKARGKKGKKPNYIYIYLNENPYSKETSVGTFKTRTQANGKI